MTNENLNSLELLALLTFANIDAAQDVAEKAERLTKMNPLVAANQIKSLVVELTALLVELAQVQSQIVVQLSEGN